jgi:hypothetical protein
MAHATHRQIRDAIAAVIAGAQANTRVQTYERYAVQLPALKELYVAEGRLIGCHIRRVSLKRTTGGIGRWHALTRWQIRFYHAIADDEASELAFDDWLDAVAQAFKADETLRTVEFPNGAVAQTGPADSQKTQGLQIDDSTPVMFCGVLCHAAKCTLWTQHFEGANA